MVNGLAVWMYGRRIGTLGRERRKLSFSYTREALQLGVGLPLLSVSMPTQARTYRHEVTSAFFEGLLPEGEAREIIAYDFGIRSSDVFALLSALGRDCAGALIVVPEEEAPSAEGLPESITDAEVAERLRNLRSAPLGVDQRVRVSLAGLQGKLLLSRLSNGWGLPIDGAPSTHIIKPPHASFEEMIPNEYLCMRFAHHLGLQVAEVETGEFNELPVLIIRRYDREDDNEGHRIRIHQEDFCQAHALGAARKYEDKGGPSLRSCAEILKRWARGPEQLYRLLDTASLNVLVGNADAHAKNLSLLHSRSGEITLAPAYDILSTAYYGNVSTTPGMFIDGVRNINAIHRDELVREATVWGLSEKVARERVEDIFAKAKMALEAATEETEPPQKLATSLRKRVRYLTR